MRLQLLVLMSLALLSGGCTAARQSTIPPPPPHRVVPSECRAEVDQPVVERLPAPELEARVCDQVDHDQWAACVADKARELARLKELDRQDKQVERDRRRACVRFIDAEGATEPRPGSSASAPPGAAVVGPVPAPATRP